MRVRGDGIDLENLEACVESLGYDLIAGRYRKRLEALKLELLTAASWEATLKLQARIHELEMTLATPKQIADDIRKRGETYKKGPG